MLYHATKIPTQKLIADIRSKFGVKFSMLLSIIIVNYRVRFFLEQCLHSVQQATAGMAAQIIVVDNDPAEGSMAYLQPRFPQVQFIAN
ncbi:MAG: hypothetical protein EAY75_04845, partial [Bacteroidetes bacterium]